MSRTRQITIDVTEKFPLLASAPIVEAVVDIRARPTGEWSEEFLRSRLATKLPNYPDVRSQREVHIHAKVITAGEAEHLHRDKWRGVRFTSADALHVAQFNRDGFVFSRLTPYKNWDQFCGEALRLWALHAELAKPSEIQRLGLRFINRIPMPSDDYRPSDIWKAPPTAPKDLKLPIADYLRQDTFQVPGHPYIVRRTQAIQPPTPKSPDEVGLILDIDVSSTRPCQSSTEKLRTRLIEMRWLKNKMFFASITPRAIKRFQEGIG